jgi:hypothetical protein
MLAAGCPVVAGNEIFGYYRGSAASELANDLVVVPSDAEEAALPEVA